MNDKQIDSLRNIRNIACYCLDNNMPKQNYHLGMKDAVNQLLAFKENKNSRMNDYVDECITIANHNINTNIQKNYNLGKMFVYNLYKL